MTTGQKVGIGLGVAAVVGVGAYMLLKNTGGGTPPITPSVGGGVMCKDGTPGNATAQPCLGHGGIAGAGGGQSQQSALQQILKALGLKKQTQQQNPKGSGAGSSGSGGGSGTAGSPKPSGGGGTGTAPLGPSPYTPKDEVANSGYGQSYNWQYGEYGSQLSGYGQSYNWQYGEYGSQLSSGY